MPADNYTAIDAMILGAKVVAVVIMICILLSFLIKACSDDQTNFGEVVTCTVISLLLLCFAVMGAAGFLTTIGLVYGGLTGIYK